MIVDKVYLNDIATRMGLIQSTRPEADLATEKRGARFILSVLIFRKVYK
jgi:hypothetical protein